MKGLMGGLAAVAVGFLVLPVLALLPMSLSGTRWLALPPRDLSLRWYATFFTDRDWIEATLVSLRVAAGATVLAVALGTLAGVGLARGRFPGRGLVRALALSPLVVPVMVLAVSLYYVFGRAGLVGTLTGLVLAHALLGVPYVVLNVEAVMPGFDVRLERAARVLGATAWQAFRRVTLPLIRAGVLAGALFAFVASLDEVVVAMFLSGTSAITLPKLMWDSITQDELNPVVTAVASLQIAVAVLAFGGSELLRRRAARLAAAGGGPAEGPGAPPGPSGSGPPVRLDPAPLRLDRVSKRFGAILAVDQVTLDIQPGEFVTLLGPSGSGKTTLLNLVAGFEPLTSGEIVLGGRPITRKPPNRRNIGMVFQDLALFPHLTVFENVAFPLRLRRVPAPTIRSRVDEMLDLVRLAGYGGRQPRELSGGQQQRVALARALVFRPPLLLMDEPFGALDRALRQRMQMELRQLHRRLGVTIVFVTHDQEEAMALADRIVVIDGGRIQQIGQPAELYEAPANPFVAGFIGESNLLGCVVLGGEGGALLRVRTDGGSEFAVARPVAGPIVPGTARHLAVRPESLRLHAGRPPRPHALPGVVEETIYLGSVLRYLVRINSSEVLVVRAARQAGVLPAAAGATVQLEWNPQELLLL